MQDDDGIGMDSDEFDEELEEEQERKQQQKLKTPLRHTTGLFARSVSLICNYLVVFHLARKVRTWTPNACASASGLDM